MARSGRRMPFGPGSASPFEGARGGRRGSMQVTPRRLLALVSTAVLLAACGGETTQPGGGGGEEDGGEATSDIRVSVAFDVGGLGDQSFNDAANAGLQAAIEEGLV